jgi:5-methylcytosine-specific restriction endonuclease McrA
MKWELIIFSITVFLAANTYYDGKYLQLLKSWKKYYEMAFYVFLGFSIYMMSKKNPDQSQNMLLHANNLVKYLPINKEALHMINPILDFTGYNQPIQNTPGHNIHSQHATPQTAQMYSGNQQGGSKKNPNATKRSVSETKKKWVASQQNWSCGKCKKQLNAWYEVDHRIRLEHGGSNHIENLIALCRECHGEKTARERISML